MQNIVAILNELGIDVPEDKQAELNRRTAENYITKAEYDKKISRAEAERDDWKMKAENAQSTLKNFDGIDPDKIQSEIEGYKQKSAELEADFNRKIYERDFSDALKSEIDGIKFTSEAAKKAVTAEVKDAGLTLKDGRILGFHDLINQIKERDSSAFADSDAEKAKASAAKFTVPTGLQANGTMTKDKFKGMSLDERLKLKQSDPETYKQMKG